MIRQRSLYEDTLLSVFNRAGEDAVRYMRSLNTFKDQTANLRNSEGFAVYRDRMIIYNGYPNNTTGKSKGPRIGASIGRQLADDVAKEFAPSKGFLLVVTAGMEYAIYVEAKGHDVITGGSKQGARFLKRRMREIHNKIR